MALRSLPARDWRSLGLSGGPGSDPLDGAGVHTLPRQCLRLPPIHHPVHSRSVPSLALAFAFLQGPKDLDTGWGGGHSVGLAVPQKVCASAAGLTRRPLCLSGPRCQGLLRRSEGHG